ncbi:MAG: class I SAM-dependent methyltransferase [Actinomycetota bacterium]|nr:class I SAM-dependent methyltransferase [Actinomycetota bacterium]
MATTDTYGGLGARVYSAYIERPLLGRAVIRLVWGGDARPMYERLEALRDLEGGLTVIDAACGAGLALRWLEPSRVGRYLGVDNSPTMLGRARERARRHGFHSAELEQADIATIPLEARAADVYLLYNALHVVPEPEAAVAEAVRCLKPGGRLEGSMLLRGEVARVDRFFKREQVKPSGLLGPSGTRSDLRRWLEGLSDVEVEVGGSLATFRARRP